MAEMDILGFVAHLGRATAEYEMHKHHQLEKAAKLVEDAAKHELGAYQDAAGPFTHWKDLADATKADRMLQGYPENEPLLRDGTLRESIEHRVGSDEAAVGSNLDIAEWQELGTTKIPPRSFLGIAAVNNGEHVARILGDAATLALVGEEVFEGRIKIR